MSAVLRVALLGFSTFERAAIKAVFAQAGQRRPGYALVPDLEASDLLLADAEHMAAVRLVLATERLADTVFVGRTQAMAVVGAAAWLSRPIDPGHLLREFDALLAQRGLSQAGASSKPFVAVPAPVPVRNGHGGNGGSGPEATVVPAGRADPAGGLSGIVDASDASDASGAAAASDAAVLHAAASAARLGAQPADAAFRAPLALVVDDSETARQGMAQRLQQWGFDVEQAAHSGQALALLSRRSFDSVFIDVNLGPASALDGFALCQRLKRQPLHGLRPPLWVALVTALNSPSDRVRGTLAGCDAYLTKPVDSDELARLLWVQGWAPPPPRLLGSPPAV